MTSKNEVYVDFRTIKEEVSIIDVLTHYGVWNAFKGKGTQRRGPCPMCDADSKRKFNANLQKNIWYCFGDCKRGGNVIDLVAVKEGCGARDAAYQLARWFGLLDTASKPQRSKKKRKSKTPKEPDPCVEGSQSNAPLTFERLKHLDETHEALVDNGIRSETAEHFGVGYATKGIMRGCIAIPVHDRDGRLLAYAGADPDEPHAPYRWPRGFEPSLELYNAHRCLAVKKASKSELILVRDFFDVFALYVAGHVNVVALMGEDVSQAQLAGLRELLKRQKPKHITLAYGKEHLDDEPPFSLIGKLATLAPCRAVALSTFLSGKE